MAAVHIPGIQAGIKAPPSTAYQIVDVPGNLSRRDPASQTARPLSWAPGATTVRGCRSATRPRSGTWPSTRDNTYGNILWIK